MMLRIPILLLPLWLFLVGPSPPARAAYFPDPVPTAEWDLIGGEIFGGDVPIGSEVAAWDAAGVLRFRTDVDTLDNFFGLAAFYGPPTGSLDPHDFTWRIFDGLSVWSATVHDGDGTSWFSYQGGTPGGTFVLNLDRDEPVGVAPEPATIVILGLLGASGVTAGIKKKQGVKL